MVTHVVLFKFAESAQAEAAADKLRAMEGKVAGLDGITVGIDENRGPRAYDLCLITTHSDAEALAQYQADPLHGEVKEYLGAISTGAAVVDFSA